MGLTGRDVKDLILANLAYHGEEPNFASVATIANVRKDYATRAFRDAKIKLKDKYHSSFPELVPPGQLITTMSDDESKEGEVGYLPSKLRRKRLRQRIRERPTEEIPDSVEEDTELEANGPSQNKPKPSHSAQHRRNKKKDAKNNGNTNVSTRDDVQTHKRDPSNPRTKTSGPYTRRSAYRKVTAKRGRGTYNTQEGSRVGNSAIRLDENTKLSRHTTQDLMPQGSDRHKGVVTSLEPASTTDNQSGIQGNGRRRSPAIPNSGSVKTKSQNGHLDDYSVQVLIPGAMDGFTLEGKAPRNTEHDVETPEHVDRSDNIKQEDTEDDERGVVVNIEGHAVRDDNIKEVGV